MEKLAPARCPALRLRWLGLLLASAPPALAIDYTVLTTGTSPTETLTVTNITNNGDTRTVSEPSNGNIEFAATSHIFTVNVTQKSSGNSGSVSLTDVSSVVINTGSGNATMSVDALANSAFPKLVYHG